MEQLTGNKISPESMEKELILQIGAREGSNADTADGSVGQPTKSLVDLIKEVVTGSNQQYGWVPDLIRDLGIAPWISVIVTFLVEKYASDRLRGTGAGSSSRSAGLCSDSGAGLGSARWDDALRGGREQFQVRGKISG